MVTRAPRKQGIPHHRRKRKGSHTTPASRCDAHRRRRRKAFARTRNLQGGDERTCTRGRTWGSPQPRPNLHERQATAGAEEAKDPRHSQDLELQIKRTTGSHQAHGT
jgi:hypothetical protein